MKYDDALLIAAIEKVELLRITSCRKIRRLAFTNFGEKTDKFVQVLHDGSTIAWQSTVEDRKSDNWERL